MHFVSVYSYFSVVLGHFWQFFDNTFCYHYTTSLILLPLGALQTLNVESKFKVYRTYGFWTMAICFINEYPEPKIWKESGARKLKSFKLSNVNKNWHTGSFQWELHNSKLEKILGILTCSQVSKTVFLLFLSYANAHLQAMHTKVYPSKDLATNNAG